MAPETAESIMTGKYSSVSYNLKFSSCALEICGAEISLICKLLIQGQTVPELLEAFVYGN